MTRKPRPLRPPVSEPDPEAIRAREAAVRIATPVALDSFEFRRRAVLPETDLLTSYMTQSYLWRDGEQLRVLQPRPGHPDAVPGSDLHAGTTIWFVSAWNPHGEPDSATAHQERTARLRRELSSAGIRVHGEATALAADRSWLEDVLLVDGLAEPDAVRVARDAGQPAVLGWTSSTRHGDVITIVPTGLRKEIPRRSLPYVEEAVPATCPMRTDRVPGERCVMYGGPFTSASIHAAMIWTTHRRLMLDRFGCDPCTDGTGPIAGQWGAGGPSGSPAGELLPASRYGSYVWRSVPHDR